MYEYKECGLDGIRLVNGYKIEKTPYGEGVRIEDIKGLHRAIGNILINKAEKLTGKEFRFLRVELGFSQKRLAGLFGTEEQNIGRWERGDVEEIPGPADRLMRALYAEYARSDSKISDMVQRLCDLDRTIADLEKGLSHSPEEGWKTAA